MIIVQIKTISNDLNITLDVYVFVIYGANYLISFLLHIDTWEVLRKKEAIVSRLSTLRSTLLSPAVNDVRCTHDFLTFCTAIELKSIELFAIIKKTWWLSLVKKIE